MTQPPPNLVVRFKGWATIRLPTDPDPADAKRGASGYTYAFAGEPDLDRVIRFQPQEEEGHVRPGAPWQWGVFVDDAFIVHADATTHPVGELTGAAVRLHGGPRLENRNWLFTLPGWEPVVPFDLQIGDGPNELRRTAPLTRDDTPLYKIPTPVLMAQGAKGVNIEPETVGTATGIWDAMALLRHRKTTLEGLLQNETDPVKRVALESRLYELEFALADPSDRRVIAHYAVERFWFPMQGTQPVIPTSGPIAGLDPDSPWMLSYFFAAWDFDTLGAYVQGALQIPFATSQAAG